MSELADACTVWQAERAGSSLLRGGARVVTGIPHYFTADYITDYEDAARNDTSGATLARARTLLKAVRESEPLTAEEWRDHCGLPPDCFAGRGIASKPEDDQIVAALTKGEITMPLWGISLDRTVADGYGTRFRFELRGPFHGVAAWEASGIKTDDYEIITGGTYRIDSVRDEITTVGDETVTTTVATIFEHRLIDAV